MPKRKFFNSQKRTSPARSTYFDVSSIDPLPVYEHFVEDLRQSNDEWAWGCCPFHDDNNPSFNVNLRSGYFRCMSSSCGMQGGLVGFVSALLSLDARDAIRYLEERHAVRDYLRLRLGDRPHEIFAVMFLDAQHRVIETVELFRGTLTQTSVYPREVLVEALSRQAAAVILCHNHPSGVATPSQNDIRLTQTLKEVLALVDVRVLDHFVVTRTQVLSMAEQGLV